MKAQCKSVTRALLMLTAAVSSAQPVTAHPSIEEVDAVFKRYDSSSTPGCSVAVLEAGRVIFRKSYGMADPALGVPMTSKTTTWIPYSETRIFLALAIGLLQREGTLSLNDPVRRHVPEVPKYAEGVTIRHLLFHTSGLPDYGVLAGPGWELGDRMSEDEFFRIVSRWGSLTFDPGKAEGYSNTDYALLKILVERVSGGSLHEFLASRLLEPLGMTSTRIGFDQARVEANHALFHQSSSRGYEKVLRYRISPVGQIAVTTSLDDIIRFELALRNNAIGVNDLINGLVEASETAPASDEDRELPFGVYHRSHKGIPLVEYRGIGGYNFLVKVQDRDISVATLCNIYEGVQSFGPDVAALYAGIDPQGAKPAVSMRRPPSLPSVREPVSVPIAELEALTGEYRTTKGGSPPVDIVLVDGTIVSKPRGREPVPLAKPLGNGIFETTFQGSPFIVWFERDGDEMFLSVWDVEADEPAGETLIRQQRWQPKAEDLTAYVGTYVGDKVDLSFQVRAETDRLLIAGRGLAETTLLAGENPDEFTLPDDYWLSFERDVSGQVAALVLHATRVRDIRLARKP